MSDLDGVVVREGPTILLRSGSYFDLLNPEGSSFTIEDIAHSLAHLCRFTGHTKRFYSVAEHSWWCSLIVPRQDALAALLHDAAEAFVGDVSRPLKMLLPEYRRIEDRILRAVLERFLLSPVLPASVKAADRRMLRSEQVDAMDSTEDWPGLESQVSRVRLCFFSPEQARLKFLGRFHELRMEAGRHVG